MFSFYSAVGFLAQLATTLRVHLMQRNTNSEVTKSTEVKVIYIEQKEDCFIETRSGAIPKEI